METNNLSAIVADNLADWTANCQQKSPDELGSYIKQVWRPVDRSSPAYGCLLREMKRKFKLRSRKKKVEGTFETINGFTSFENWFVWATGLTKRMAWYAMVKETKKHKTKSANVKKLVLMPTKNWMEEFEERAKRRGVTVEDWALAKLIN